MRVLVVEYVTGGGLSDDSPSPSLVREGELLLRALVRDLADVAGVEVATLRDARLERVDLPAEVYYVRTRAEHEARWAALLDEVDAVWPVAPETAGHLERVSAQVLAQGKPLLGSRPEAIRIAASKRASARHLTDHGLPVVPSSPPCDLARVGDGPWVVKPDDGVGCEGVQLCHDLAELCCRQRPRSPIVVQPYTAGVPASLTVLCRAGQARLLSRNVQRVSVVDNAFRLLGCTVNGLSAPEDELQALAIGVAAALPGLWGLVGIDLIATDAGPRLLEVNPRVTTSYAGLREALGENPARMVLELLRDEPLTPPPTGSAVVDVDLS